MELWYCDKIIVILTYIYIFYIYRTQASWVLTTNPTLGVGVVVVGKSKPTNNNNKNTQLIKIISQGNQDRLINVQY